MKRGPDYYEQLVESVKSGQRIPADVLADIRQQLETGRFEADPYTLIHLIGLAGDRQSSDIVWRYTRAGLESPSESAEDEVNDSAALLRRIALWVLGRAWKLPEAFPLAAHMLVVDPSGYVQDVAAGTLAGWVRSGSRIATRGIAWGWRRARAGVAE